MSLRSSNLYVEIAVSNMDLYPIDLPGRASWGSDLEQLAPYLEKTGCRNFEIHPTETIMQDVVEREQCGDVEAISSIVGSVHQTFNNGRDVLGRVADWRGVQRSQASLVGMGAIAAAVARPIPGVCYPDGLSKNEATALNRTAYSVVQPCAEIYRDFGVRSNTDLLQAMSRRSILGFCPDTVHARRQAEDGTRPPPIADVWADQFASGYVYEMHVGADRVDMGTRDPDFAAKSGKEFQAFVSRRWQNARDTEMGDMITAAVENWVPPRALTQAIGGRVLRQVIEIPPRPQAILGRIKEHARFVDNLAEVVREAGATPLLWGDT